MPLFSPLRPGDCGFHQHGDRLVGRRAHEVVKVSVIGAMTVERLLLPLRVRRGAFTSSG